MQAARTEQDRWKGRQSSPLFEYQAGHTRDSVWGINAVLTCLSGARYRGHRHWTSADKLLAAKGSIRIERCKSKKANDGIDIVSHVISLPPNGRKGNLCRRKAWSFEKQLKHAIRMDRGHLPICQGFFPLLSIRLHSAESQAAHLLLPGCQRTSIAYNASTEAKAAERLTCCSTNPG